MTRNQLLTIIGETSMQKKAGFDGPFTLTNILAILGGGSGALAGGIKSFMDSKAVKANKKAAAVLALYGAIAGGRVGAAVGAFPGLAGDGIRFLINK